MAGEGHNKPPPEFTEEEHRFIQAVLERDMRQSLAILEMVQKGKMSREAAESAVAYTEQARPIVKKIKEWLA